MGRLYLIAVLLFILPPAAHAEVVFSDDFEWGSDWNSSQGTTAPIANGWSGILCTNRGGSYEAAYVNSAGAKQGSRGFIQSDGTGIYYASDTSITGPTIENGHLLALDFDDTDTPTYVKVTIYGYYNADVN